MPLLPVRAWAEEAHVLKIIDGDSLLVEVRGLRTQVRLIGVDAPEHDQEPWGDRAKEFVVAFLQRGGPVNLEYDRDKFGPYNRLLAYVWLDGKMLNEELAARGLAWAKQYGSRPKYWERLKKAMAEAKAAGVGIWSAHPRVPPAWKHRAEQRKK
jgi:micrococcal nuclease